MAQGGSNSFAQFTIKLTGNASDLSDIVSDLGTEYYIDKSAGEVVAKKEIQIQKEDFKFPPKKRKLKMTEEILPKRVILVVPKDSPVPSTITSNDVINHENAEVDTAPRKDNQLENDQLLRVIKKETQPTSKPSPIKLFKLMNIRKSGVSNDEGTTNNIKINTIKLPVIKTSVENILFKQLTKLNEEKKRQEKIAIEEKKPEEKKPETIIPIEEKKSNEPLEVGNSLFEYVGVDKHVDEAVEPLNFELMENLGLTYCKNGNDAKLPSNDSSITVSPEKSIVVPSKPKIESPLKSSPNKEVKPAAVKAPEHIKRRKKRKMLNRKPKKSHNIQQTATNDEKKKKRGRPKKRKKPDAEELGLLTFAQRSEAIRQMLSDKIGIPILEPFMMDNNLQNKKVTDINDPSIESISTLRLLNNENPPVKDEGELETGSKMTELSPEQTRRKSLRILKREKLLTECSLTTEEFKKQIFSSTSEKPIVVKCEENDEDPQELSLNYANEIDDNKEDLQKFPLDYIDGVDKIKIEDLDESSSTQPQIHQYIINHSPNNPTETTNSNISYIKVMNPSTSNSTSPTKNSDGFDQSNPVFFKGLKVYKRVNLFDKTNDAVQDEKNSTIIKSPIKTENSAWPDLSKGYETPRGSLSSGSSAKGDITIQASPKSDASTSKSPHIKIINGVKCSLKAMDPKLLKDEVLRDKIQRLLSKSLPNSFRPIKKFTSKSELTSEISESLVSTTTTESNQIPKKDCQLCDKLRIEINELWGVIKNLKKQLSMYKHEYEDKSIKISDKKSLLDDLEVADKIIHQLEERNRNLTDQIRNETLSSEKLRISLTHRDNQIKDLKSRLSEVTKIFSEVEGNVLHVKKQLEITESKNMGNYKKNVQNDGVHHT